MKIVFVSSEVYPFSKTGGLADVSNAMPKALGKKNEICIFTPLYKFIKKEESDLKLVSAPLIVPLENEDKFFALFTSDSISNVTTYFIDYEPYFGRNDLYGEMNIDYPDNPLRFIFFAKAALSSLKYINYKPDIIHCNDWHTGFIPLYIKTVLKNDEFYKKMGSVLTVHNAGYQGVYPESSFDVTDLARSDINNIKHKDGISFLKAGLLYADAVTTVSRKYMQEVQTEEYGYDLADVFKSVKSRFYGIANAIDDEIWDPRKDEYIIKNYSDIDLSGKADCKRGLQKLMDLPEDQDIPVIGTVSRLTYQKGMDVLADSLELLLQDEAFQFAITGTGDRNIKQKFERLKHMFPERIGLFWGFDEPHEHLAVAGPDIYIMPSRYEPCGLNQMYSLKYGTVPVVRATGGLDDIVRQWDNTNKTGNGFKFTGLSSGEIYNTLRKVIYEYNARHNWRVIQKNGMAFNRSWELAAPEYENVYKIVINKQ